MERTWQLLRFGFPQASRRATAAMLPMALLVGLSCVPTALANFKINSMEWRPSYLIPPGKDAPELGPPADPKKHELNRDGFIAGIDSSVNLSRFTHIGCFQGDLSLTTRVTSDGIYPWDPNDCLDVCKEHFVNATVSDIIFAVFTTRCACILRDVSQFTEQPPTACDEACGNYRNPICGGQPDYWGVFREYDFMALTTQGAYDPWRYIFYTVAVMKEINIRGGLAIPDGIQPERYYLHAVDVTTGKAAFQYQMRLNGILYGLQYDLDGTRLVALFTEMNTGRIKLDGTWKYKLATIDINTQPPLNNDKPELTMNLAKVLIQYNMSENYMQFSGASGILSQQRDVFIITQIQPSADDGTGLKKDSKERIYFIRIPDGYILRSEALDFKVLQIFTNEKYGDVSALGPRDFAGDPKQSYVRLATVTRNEASETEPNIEWSYGNGGSDSQPEMLVKTDVTKDMQIYPGLSVSEHLFNYSGIAHRAPRYTDWPISENLNPSLDTRAILITEVNIRATATDIDGGRNYRNWCNKTLTNGECVGTINYEVPYASIYNEEPGIPLSLKAPAFVDARFAMEAGSITVNFDRPTLQGAKTVDLNGDRLPDEIDYSTRPDGSFDCNLLFDSTSILLLGPYPSTECRWATDSQIKIQLPPIINISVGDSLFVLPDTIYTIPRGGEWSPAALGGVQVDPPDPLLYPVIVITGSSSVDQCTPVRLRAGDSFRDGKLPTYVWSFMNSTDADPNPKDLTNNPNRIIDEHLLTVVKQSMNDATANNSDTLVIAASVMEAATSYRFQLSLTSRWGLTTHKVLTITKLNFPAPMVNILGPLLLEKKRPDRISLQAIGQPSACANTSDNLGYRWTCSSGNLDMAAVEGIVTNSATLTLPSFTLEPDLTDQVGYKIYNFTVACFINTIQGDVPDKTAYATVSVQISRSPIYVVFRSESRKVTRDGPIPLVLDARATNDPDYPTNPSATFKGTFTWKCLSPERLACFGGPASGELGDLATCRQDINNRFQDGGVTFFFPLFDDLVMCKYARGVVMFNTRRNFTIGQYKFTTQATAYDGRTAEASVYINITDFNVPRILLDIKDRKAKYPVSLPIRITGVEEGVKAPGTRTYSWTVLEYLMNPEYDPDVASVRLNDAANPYTVDQYTFVDMSHRFDTRDPNRFQTSPDNPSIIVQRSVLEPSKTYKLRLNIDIRDENGQGGTGFSDITFETAGLPPRAGSFKVTPDIASMDTPRVLKADRWVADETPLVYAFGYVDFNVVEGAAAAPVKVKYSTDPLPVSEFALANTVLGDESNNYTLQLFVEITTPFGAVTTSYTSIQSLPVENVTAAQEAGIENALKADGANVVTSLDYLLSLNPKDPTNQNAVLDILESKGDSVPVTPSLLTAQANMVSRITAGGNTGDASMRALEVLVEQAANSNAISADPSAEGGSLGQIFFSAFGDLLPGENPRAGGGSAQSLVMKKYRVPNPAFTFRDMSKPTTYTSNLHFMAGAIRQSQNHQPASPKQYVIEHCESPFCDQVGLHCTPEGVSPMMWFTCCSSRNPETLCNEPPCWFAGNKCPALKSELAGVRRLKDPMHDVALSRETGDLDRQEEGSWFQSWKNHNMPLRRISESQVSEYERAKAFHGWHPDIYRRLQIFSKLNTSQSPAELYMSLENDESTLLRDARARVRTQLIEVDDTTLNDATEVVAYNSMSPAQAARLQSAKLEKDTAAAQYAYQYARNQSQRITRIAVLRDTVSKALIVQLISNEKPLQFASGAFTIWIGKSTNLSNVHSAFSFPKQFQVPSDSPDYPTPDNPVTGFAFQYVEYSRNIYDWATRNEKGGFDPDVNMLTTLVVLKASTLELDKEEIQDPIKVFADYNLLSNVICLFWDRFAANTPGGKWSSQGIVNNEEGCLTSHLSDFGIFLDGRVYNGYQLVEAATTWEREMWSSNCIGCGDTSNLFVVAVLGMMLFTLILLVLMGYTIDERIRTDMAKNKVKSRYYFDGNGLDTPLSVDDPIAYSQAEGPLPMLWLATLWNVVKRDHALISCAFYHETFTRPQRLQCFISLLMGLLAVNAAVHAYPGNIQQATEWMVTGILSGLLVYPVFCGLVMMFYLRPVQVKKRLIKRAYSVKEIDKLNEQRQRIANQSSMLPPPGYLATPPPPPGSFQGQTTLLSLPAPLPLPPLPAGTVGSQAHLALPPGMQGLQGQLQGMTGRLPLPPRPNFPPPPKNAKFPSPAALMPPLSWPKSGAPPTPFPALQDASMGGTQMMLPGRFPGTGEAPEHGYDNEMSGMPPHALMDDAKFQMAPPDLPGAIGGPPPPPVSFTPPGGTPGGGTPARTPPGGSPAPGTPIGSRGGFGPLGGGVGLPGAATPLSQRSSGGASSRGPGPPLPMVPADSGPMPLFIRGQPPPNLPTPFPKAPPGPAGVGGLPGVLAPGVPLVPPAPPPPPREDDQAFVRRIRLVYMDKVTKEHDKHDLLEDMEELGKETPGWVYDTMTVMPYFASSIFTLVAVFIVLQYGMKFQRLPESNSSLQEEMWMKGSMVGLGLVLLVLDFIRVVMLTLVELRKYENRRKAKDGHFLPRRIKREDDKDFQAAPPPRLWKQAVAAPPVPPGPGSLTARPPWLPKEGSASGSNSRGTPSLGNLPVGAGPPSFSAASMAAGGSFSGAPPPPPIGNFGGAPGGSSGPATPKSQFSGTGRSGFPPNPGAATPGTPGTPGGSQRGRGPGPPLQTAEALMAGGASGSRGPSRGTSPRDSSLHSLAQSLKKEVKAGIHPNPPPPPGATVTSSSAPPPPPSAQRPAYQRPPSGSRPTSAGSAASKARAPGPPPPP
eukprot:TRINITY_DN27167_c0_g2_i1.p1 TRINITY_DN27167_c0_g2~~TRINITY_DN27167_c0_g2_i1.p1  ORF type:complete len:2805 (-),score=431.05 TRINITY_DN27167_c0_g2_i1:54-8468(-)